MDDPDWRRDALTDTREHIHAFFKLTNNILEMKGDYEPTHLEGWLLSVIQYRIKKIEASMNELRTRTALENALFEVWKDLRWYFRRADNPNPTTIGQFLNIWIRLLSPFIPHLCEEVWQKMGKGGFIALSNWPIYDKSKTDLAAEEGEGLIKKILEDTNGITKIMKTPPQKIIYYVSSRWKWDIFIKILGEDNTSVGELIGKALQNDELIGKVDKKKIVGYIKKMTENIARFPKELKQNRLKVGHIDEYEIVQNAKSFLKRELNCEVEVFREDESSRYDPEDRACLSQPYRPGIYIE